MNKCRGNQSTEYKSHKKEKLETKLLSMAHSKSAQYTLYICVCVSVCVYFLTQCTSTIGCC